MCSEFTIRTDRVYNCPPPLGSPRFARGTARGALIPIAEPEFTNSCVCRIPPLPALSPLVKGGEGGFEPCAFTNFGSAGGKCLCVRFSTCAPLRAGGNHRGLPLHNGVSVGADPRVCPNSHVEIISRRHLPVAEPEFISAPPPLGSPRFARGTAWGAWVRFPLLAGGTACCFAPRCARGTECV